MRPELEVVLRSVAEVPISELPTLLGELEVIRATAIARMSSPIREKPHDQLLNVTAAGQRLGVSKDYLYRHSSEFPFTRRIGKRLLFSSQGIDAHISHQKNGRLRNY